MFLFIPPCLDDCTKVLVAPARPIVREQVVKEVPKPKKDDVKVVAGIEDEETGMSSPAKCTVINDTITCEW
jgi:hypothetical protein